MANLTFNAHSVDHNPNLYTLTALILNIKNSKIYAIEKISIIDMKLKIFKFRLFSFGSFS